MAAQTENQGPGQDSFLDIVANLVGILIILVVVIGAQAGEAVLKNRAADNDEMVEKAKLELQQATERYQEAIDAQRRIELLSNAEDRNSHQHNEHRSQLLMMLEQTRKKTQAVQQNLAAQNREQLQTKQLTAKLKNQLTSIEHQIGTLAKTKQKTESIEHIPTPIAKTVFNDEVHFRLMGGRIAYVPMEQLINLMRKEWEIKAQTLQPDSSSVEMVGPIDGFRMKYSLESFTQKIKTPYGPIDHQIKQFNRFILVPDRQILGNEVEQALVETSTFSQRIQRLDPGKHTISLWVYPDSFAEYNRIKKWFYQRGFRIACWPIPEGQPIAGGPNGSRSIAQ